MASEQIQPEYRAHIPRKPHTRIFEQALHTYLGRPSRASVEALLGRQVPYASIKNWRNGRHRPAQWAAEILASKLERWAAEITSQARAVRSIAYDPETNTGSPQALAAWRARRAAQKEKARE